MGEFVCRKPSVKTHPSPQPQSKSASQAVLLQNIVTQDVFVILVNHIILATQPKLKTKTMFHYDELVSILI